MACFRKNEKAGGINIVVQLAVRAGLDVDDKIIAWESGGQWDDRTLSGLSPAIIPQASIPILRRLHVIRGENDDGPARGFRSEVPGVHAASPLVVPDDFVGAV